MSQLPGSHYPAAPVITHAPRPAGTVGSAGPASSLPASIHSGEVVSRYSSQADSALFSNNRSQSSPKNADHQKKDRGLLILGVVKTLVGGLIVGGTVATVEKVRFWPMVAVDMLLGLGETFLAKWIIESNDAPAKKILGFSSRVSKAPDIPVEQMSHTEREQALTPISVIVSALSAMLTLGVGDWMKKHEKMQREPITQADVDSASGARRFLRRSQYVIQETGHKFKMPESIASKGLYKYTVGSKVGKTLIAAMAVGLLEGLLTQKIIRDEKNENSLYHKLVTLLKFQ